MPETKKQLTVTARAIAVIYVLFNILYFTNAIPPLPLSMKDAGVYHSVMHDQVAGTYTVVGEQSPWYDFMFPFDDVFHETPGGSAFVYTSVFAPSGLSTQILHEWQYYDAVKKAGSPRRRSNIRSRAAATAAMKDTRNCSIPRPANGGSTLSRNTEL